MSTSTLIPPATVPSISLDEIARLAWRIESTGLTGLEPLVQRVVARARQTPTVSPVLAAVLADPGEPEVARIRAYGLVALQLGATDAPRAA